MAYINLENDLPGIRGPMAYSPETAKHLNALAEILLHDENNTLSRGEREMIGAYVSSENDCFFCQNVHGALAQHYFKSNMQFIDDIKKDFRATSISEKLKLLLTIAGSV
jgi:alkylhydroperoxidase family enzyme